VHGKRSLLDKMAGEGWARFANLRLLFASQFAQPGKKLLFMGDELAQGLEWNHDRSLDWHLLDVSQHAGVQAWVDDLNRFYRESTAMHALDCSPLGFQWVDCHDGENSVLSLLRRAGPDGPLVLAVLNFTPLPREGYRLGVPRGGYWREALNSDAHRYGGTGWGNYGGVEARAEPMHGRPYSLDLTLPPLGALFFTST
jgi:1,4-alpha-glucan branching enzyme